MIDEYGLYYLEEERLFGGEPKYKLCKVCKQYVDEDRFNEIACVCDDCVDKMFREDVMLDYLTENELLGTFIRWYFADIIDDILYKEFDNVLRERKMGQHSDLPDFLKDYVEVSGVEEYAEFIGNSYYDF